MALTKVSTDGVKDDAITKTKIPANQIEASELADNAVDTNAIADQAVALSKLPHGTSSNDGKFLRANNGADPTFETVTGTTINNNADNRVITGSGTANTLEGEANLTFDGSNLAISGELDVHKSGTGDVFHVQGNGTGAVVAKVENAYNSDNDRFAILELKSGKCSIRFNSNGDSNEGAITYNMADNTMVFGVNNASEKLRIQSGGGISFNGDTAAANALDDYEEGTFSLTVASGGFSSITGTGIYTRIGRSVIFQGDFEFVGSGDSSILKLDGLPYVTSEWCACSGYARYYNNEGSQQASWAVRGSTNDISVVEYGNEASGNAFGAGYFNVAGCYQV